MRPGRSRSGLPALAARYLDGNTLPYNPTQLLLSPNSTTVYVFQGNQLSQYNVSQTITQEVSPVVLDQQLPFLPGNVNRPYTSVAHSNGNITVITGNCSAGSQETEVWSFTHKARSGNGNGTWTQYDTTSSGSSLAGVSAGANYLGNAVSFSSIANATSDGEIYAFGGMCPEMATAGESWTAAANYSSTMLTYTTSDSSQTSVEIDVAATSLRAGPVAEAGFTMTGLTPILSGGSNTQNRSQQQSFLLIGGHTQNAFINMSQIALYSLPQQNWNYFPVSQPSTARIDLTVRQAVTTVEPRSGHTAVLSEDGNSVIVFGGWVGDITTPAEPQLAILSLGAGYGADSQSQDWSWSIPTQANTAIGVSGALYGHGAVMLPGGVMMILGGYTISNSSSSKRAALSQNTLTYFYNVTSNSWLSSYDPSSMVSSGGQTVDHHSGGALSTTAQQAGLGVGLGIGALILIALILFYFWYSRRLRRQEEARQRVLLTHSSNSSYGPQDLPFLEKNMNDGHDGGAYMAPALNNGQYQSAFGNRASMQHAAGSTGLFVDIPSPTRGLRKGLASRPYSYHVAPRYEDGRIGGIHPIEEHSDEQLRSLADDDDDDDEIRILNNPKRRLRENPHFAASIGSRHGEIGAVDPFSDPDPLRSNPVSPVAGDTVRRVPTHESSLRDESPTRRPAGMITEGNWRIVDSTDDLLLDHGGRASPTKTDDRTSSTLSDMSHRSGVSITRTMSTRTGALLAAAFVNRHDREVAGAATLSSSSSDGRTNTMSSGRLSPYHWQHIPRTATNDSHRQVYSRMTDRSIDSFATAHSSFAQLQTEGEALLGGRRVMVDRDDPYQRALAAANRGPAQYHNTYSPYDSAPAPNVPTRRRQGLLGSLRRALTGMSMSDRSFSLTTTTGGYEDEPNTRASSPTKHRTAAAAAAAAAAAIASSSTRPRRAVSDGDALLLRSKRGQKDWDDDLNAPYRDDPGDWGEEPSTLTGRRSDEASRQQEWDVEGAANKRDFQVMFSVPKARLRVVNADAERSSLRSVSEGGGVSRAGSLRVGRADSLKNSGGIGRTESFRNGSGEGKAMGGLEVMKEESAIGDAGEDAEKVKSV